MKIKILKPIYETFKAYLSKVYNYFNNSAQT